MRALLRSVPATEEGTEALVDAAHRAASQGHAGPLGQLLHCLTARLKDGGERDYEWAQAKRLAGLLNSTVIPCAAAGGGRCIRCTEAGAPPHDPRISFDACVAVLAHYGARVAPGPRSAPEQRRWNAALAAKPTPNLRRLRHLLRPDQAEALRPLPAHAVLRCGLPARGLAAAQGRLPEESGAMSADSSAVYISSRYLMRIATCMRQPSAAQPCVQLPQRCSASRPARER